MQYTNNYMYIKFPYLVASRSFSHQESNQSGISDNSSLLSSYVSIPSITDSQDFDTTSKYKEIQTSLAKLDAVSVHLIYP